MRTVAVVEDDFDQRENMVDGLSHHGFQVRAYKNRGEASAAFKQDLPDLAVLDIMLEEEMDGGFDLCRELRQASSKLPIIFLTSRDSDMDRVSGLRLDAWDYLVKPVSIDYLAVRIHSLFRIADAFGDAAEPEQEMLNRGELSINLNSMKVTWKSRPIKLTLTEFWIVEAMARRPHHVKTYDDIMQVTRQSYVEKNSINGYIRRIRNKFKEHDNEFDCIETVFGMGYRWQCK
jgi:two-component system OmpR family response regulator